MKTAYIHIGTEKTGSTSIQALLKENSTALRQRGYHVANIQCPTNHMDFVAYCIDRYPNAQQKALLNFLNINDPVQHLNWKCQFQSKTERQLSKTHPENNLIITSEHFHSRLKNVDEIANLKELLSPYYRQFKIIVYLRRQDKLALSLFNEALKFGGAGRNPLYAGQCPNSPFYDYLNLIEMWTYTFGKEHISVRIFEQSRFHKQSLYRDFLKEVGIEDTSGLVEPPTANEALSGYKQHLLLLFNDLTSKHGTHHKTYTEIRAQIVNSTYNHQGIPQFEVSNQEREQFLSRFAESNAFLSEAWLSGNGFRHLNGDEQKTNKDSSKGKAPPTKEQLENLLTREILHYLHTIGKQALESKENQEKYQTNFEAVLDLTPGLTENNASKIRQKNFPMKY